MLHCAAMSIFRSAQKWNSLLRDASLCVCLCGLAALLADGLHSFQQRKSNQHELQSLADNIIKTAEYSIDYGILTAFDAIAKTSEPCSPAGKLQLQELVHAKSIVKDIVVLGPDNTVKCSSFELPTSATTVSQRVPARNDSFALHNVMLAGRDMLGVSWQHSDLMSILVALDFDAQLFASLPPEIRDDSRGMLAVSGNGAVATFGRDLKIEESFATRAVSERFPVSMMLRIDDACLALWNGQNRALFIWLGVFCGLLASALAVRELRRPASPRQMLERALSNGEIRPFAQATFDIASCRITGCEILMRWIKPTGELVPPSSFIPLAEATDMIRAMTHRIIEETLTAFSAHLAANSQFAVAFNVVPAHFVARDFADELLKLTHAAKVAPKQVVLEITERQSFEDAHQMKAAVDTLQRHGFKVALDDMGTGHNGLSHVQDLGVDVIKIDKKFVDFVGHDPAADAIVELLVGLAKKLGLKTVAEGIEREEQRLALQQAGVTSGQGYLVGKPQPLPEFLRVVGSHTQHFKPARKPLLSTDQLLHAGRDLQLAALNSSRSGVNVAS
jgi:c-di-GMP phosphodiesterase